MHVKTWLSFLMFLCLFCAVIPLSSAEEEVLIEAEDSFLIEATCEDEEAIPDEVDVIHSEETEAVDLVPETQFVVANDSSDFEIDEYGTLVRYKGFEKNVVIPGAVRVIGDDAFANDRNLKSVIIPNSVINIWWDAFSGCTNLKAITIPNSVAYIGGGAFYGCTSLNSITIPNSVTEIGSYVFGECTNLTSVQLSDRLSKLESGFFYECESLENVVLPNGVKSIEKSAFEDCEKLQSVTIPASVTSIDRDAFRDSKNAVIRGTAGSYAEKYAAAMGIPFNAPIIAFEMGCDEDEEYYDERIIYANQTYTLKAIQKPSDLARTLKWSSSSPEVATVDQNGKVMGVAEGTATITANTVDSKGKAAHITVRVPEPTHIEMSASEEIAIGDTLWIGVYAETPYSYDTGVSYPISFSSSNKEIAVIERVKKEGDDYIIYISGKKEGKATITATTSDGGKATMTVRVYKPEPTFIVIYPEKTTLGIKEKLYPILFYDVESKLTWTSSKPQIASVDKYGTITGKKAGTAKITVKTANGKKAACTVTVKAAPKKVTLNKKGTVTLKKGKTLALKATLPKNTASALTWTSSKPKIVSVDDNGKVKGLKKGTATITVTTFNKKKASVKIKVM